MSSSTQVLWVHYLPILTTIVSVAFSLSLFRRYMIKPSQHLLWWALGVAFYGSGTLVEAMITLGGNSVFLNKAWYITGAVLGGYPLAQGSLYLSYSRKWANRLTAISLPVVVVSSILVAMSPVIMANLQPTRPTGAILAWRWVRLVTPFINTYAAFFLIGGAAASAWRFRRQGGSGNRVIGNALIAVGALLPGIGGSMAKAGLVEALYIGECIGLILIWIGERTCSSSHAPMSVRVDQTSAAAG
jgi:hypothetical protein